MLCFGITNISKLICYALDLLYLCLRNLMLVDMKRIKFICVLTAMVSMFVSCGDDETMTIVSSKQITLNKGEQSQIEVVSDSPVRYGSMDEFHASVDDKGLVTANYVGETMIGVKSGDSQDYVTVQVVPVNSMLVEPYHSDFTVRRDIVIKMYGDKYTMAGDGIVYILEDMGASASFGFYFSGNKNVLYRSEVVLKPGTDKTAVEQFLSERYMPLDGGTGNEYQNTMDGGAGTVFVKLQESSDGTLTISYSSTK